MPKQLGERLGGMTMGGSVTNSYPSGKATTVPLPVMFVERDLCARPFACFLCLGSM